MGSFMLRWGAGIAAATLGMSLLLAQAAKAQETVGRWPTRVAEG
jgi:hypothetical protein